NKKKMFSYIHNFSQYQSYQRLEEGLSESSRLPYTNEKVEDLTSNVNYEEIDQLDSWYYFLMGKGIVAILWILIILAILLTSGLNENK
ncbi:4157_t:CDS:1, partial [Gigaspora rosea]